MKRILCYGDSNTWGFDPEKSAETGIHCRYDEQFRWPRVMANILGNEYEVIEAGLNGRTTCLDDKSGRTSYTDNFSGKKFNGLDAIELVFDMADPVDLIIIMLGTNDLKTVYGSSAENACEGVESIIKRIKAYIPMTSSYAAKILVISPIAIGKDKTNKYHEEFCPSSVSEAMRFKSLYKKMAETNDCEFICASDHVIPSDVDGLHLSKDGNKILGTIVADKIKEIYS